jgi:hypothetical protein
MTGCPQGIHAFLRAYSHHKSADHAGNKPHKLESWSAHELAKLPTYYVMELDKHMPASVAPHMPSPAAIAACRWLPELELSVYAAEYARTGFQGGLQWYRTRTSGLRAGGVLRTQHRPALLLHLGQERLGRLASARCVREDADEGVHAHAGLPSRRWHWSLGAAGAAGGDSTPAARFSAHGAIAVAVVRRLCGTRNCRS